MRLVLAVVLILAVTAPRPLLATSCANVIPLGVRLTPDCTWIVAQYDPGVWRDNLGAFWVIRTICRADGACATLPTTVMLADLHLGQ